MFVLKLYVRMVSVFALETNGSFASRASVLLEHDLALSKMDFGGHSFDEESVLVVKCDATDK